MLLTLTIVGIPALTWLAACLALDHWRSSRNIGRLLFVKPKWELSETEYYRAVFTAGANIFLSTIGLLYILPFLQEWYFHRERFFLGSESLKMAVMLFASDTGFYWSHRLLHIPFIYKVIHKIHHEHKSPITWSSFYVHPVELIMTFTLVFLSPVLFFRVHPLTFVAYLTILLLSLVKSHCGVDIYGYYSAKFHDLHHENFNGNYGSDLGVWDRICQTQL